MKYVLSEESAAEQIDLFMEYYEVDLEDIPEALADGVAAAKAKVEKAIRKGRVEIRDGEGLEIMQKINGGKSEVVYGELTGKAKIAMGDKTDYGKIYALLGALAGIGETAIQKLRGADLSTAECIGMLFLQV